MAAADGADGSATGYASIGLGDGKTGMSSWEAPADILKQWQEARANRRMQFKVGNYRDGDWVSNIRMLTGTIKADWIQLPVERYLAALPTLRHGVIAGVFRNKGAAPWGITRAEKLQVSVFLPNDLSLDDWYAGVYALPTVWPEASMLGDDYLRKVAGYDFHLLRKVAVRTAEPNLPLATAIEIIDILLQDASKTIRDQYARCLANQVKSSSPWTAHLKTAHNFYVTILPSAAFS